MDTQYGGQNKMSNSGLNMSRRIRRTPYTEKVIEAGVSGFTVVNHMLLPKSYKATVEEDYWHLSKNTQIWDVSCCLLYTSPSPRDLSTSRMPSSA